LLGESYTIRHNIAWEQTRYIASMIINVNVDKKAKMIRPDQLFPLPQDVYIQRGAPKSTKEQFEKFKAKAEAALAKKPVA
jgi:hypothetical protein